MSKTLFVNACVRDDSRTERIARALLEKIGTGDTDEVKLSELDFPVADGEFIANRDRLIDEEKYEDEIFDLAHQFAAADEIVIAAPHWDLSFPASLKQYIEQINAVGVTFAYTEEGVPYGLVKAKRIWYVTTAGGDAYVPYDYGYGYINALAQAYYGVKDVRIIKAEGLDLPDADVEAIVQAAIASIDEV